MGLDKQIQSILDQFEKLNPLPLEMLSPTAARNQVSLKNAIEEMAAEHVLNRIESLVKPMPEPVGKISHHLIPTPEESLLARVYSPEGSGPFPLIVFFHGGGWVIGSLDLYDSSCRGLCRACQAVIVSVAYRLAPEKKYPAAANDAYYATQWIMQHAEEFKGKANEVFVCGESAGGNLAAVTCLRALDEKGYMPRGQILVYPVTDAKLNSPSMIEFSHTIPLNNKMMPWFWDHYLQNEAQKLEKYASPMQAENVTGLPPTLILTAEYDPLRDEGEKYAHKLANAGVMVKNTRYNGMVHEFFSLSGSVDKAKDALNEVADWIKTILST